MSGIFSGSTQSAQSAQSAQLIAALVGAAADLVTCVELASQHTQQPTSAANKGI